LINSGYGFCGSYSRLTSDNQIIKTVNQKNQSDENYYCAMAYNEQSYRWERNNRPLFVENAPSDQGGCLYVSAIGQKLLGNHVFIPARLEQPSNNLSEAELLALVGWYMDDAFIERIKDLAGYKEAVKKHYQKFAQYGFLKRCIEYLKGNYLPGLVKRLHQLCEKLPKKKEKAQQSESLKKTDLSAIVGPEYLCAYHSFKLLSTFGIILINQGKTAALSNFKESYIDPLTDIIAKITDTHNTLAQKVTLATTMVTSLAAEQMLYSGISSIYSTIANKATTALFQCPSLPEQYLTTPDGILLKASQPLKTPPIAPKERVLVTLNRTEEFFTSTPFGIKHAKDFQKTIYGYDHFRAFEALKDINEHIKKGYHIVLDGLHKNQIKSTNGSKPLILMAP